MNQTSYTEWEVIKGWLQLRQVDPLSWEAQIHASMLFSLIGSAPLMDKGMARLRQVWCEVYATRRKGMSA